MNFEYVTYNIITAFGQTATAFISQNHAAGEFGRCRRILRLCLGLSLLCSTVPFFAIVLFRDTLSGFFTPNAAVIQSAGVRILCMLLFEPLCNLYEIPVGVLRGSGHALYPALSTMVGRCASHRLDLHSLPGNTDPPDALPCVSSFMGSDDCADCARASGAASFCARQRASAYNGAVSPCLTSGAGHVKRQKTDLLKPQQIHFYALIFSLRFSS